MIEVYYVGRRVVILLNTQKSSAKGNYQVELTCIEQLVPQDHLLRFIDEHLDFSFIIDKVRPFYSESKGRPSLDPILLFKMMLIGYLYGIRSERQLEQEIIPHAAYRWFLGLTFSDPVPDHSTISWNRNNRFKGTNLFQEIFDEVVHLAINHHMVAGRLLVTDSTHIQANANNNRYTMQVIQETPHEYLEELNKAVNDDRIAHGKKPLLPEEEATEEKTRKVSQTDPECGLMKRDRKPEGFCYLDHRTVDHKFNIITDVHVTPGNTNDAAVYIERLQRQIKTFGFTSTLEAVALDSGYMTPYICHKTLSMDIFAVIAERSAPTTPGIFSEKTVYLRSPSGCVRVSCRSVTCLRDNQSVRLSRVPVGCRPLCRVPFVESMYGNGIQTTQDQPACVGREQRTGRP
jgi:transposase